MVVVVLDVGLPAAMVLPLLYFFDKVPDGAGPMAEHPRLQSWLRDGCFRE